MNILSYSGSPSPSPGVRSSVAGRLKHLSLDIKYVDYFWLGYVTFESLCQNTHYGSQIIRTLYSSRMYMGMHTLADIVGGLLAASGLLFFLIPLGIQHQHQGNWQKLSFKTNSRIHWDIFSWLSWRVPLVLAPCSLGHSLSLCSGEPVQIGNMMTIFTNLYFLDNQYFW